MANTDCFPAGRAQLVIARSREFRTRYHRTIQQLFVVPVTLADFMAGLSPRTTSVEFGFDPDSQIYHYRFKSVIEDNWCSALGISRCSDICSHCAMNTGARNTGMCLIHSQEWHPLMSLHKAEALIAEAEEPVLHWIVTHAQSLKLRYCETDEEHFLVTYGRARLAWLLSKLITCLKESSVYDSYESDQA